MTYLLFSIFLLVAVATIFGSVRLKVWEHRGRLVNGTWLNEDEKIRLMSRWGAGC